MGSLAWGILSTGNIAHAFAKGVLRSRTGTLAAVGSRSVEGAARFGAEFGIDRCHGSYEALLADPAVEAVYIATPHPMHAEWVIKAAEAGKHILCEKPLALNWAEGTAMVAAALEHDVFLMEAFMYRCHPQTQRLAQLIREGAIGEVKLIDAVFSFQAGYDPNGRLFANAMAGGGIMDVGCYCTSMARLVAGAAHGQLFLDPTEVTGAGHVGASRVDEYAAAVLRFPGDIVAKIATGIRLRQENVVRIYGTEGELFIPSPWFCSGNEPGVAHLHLTRYGQEPQDIAIPVEDGLYSIEADTVATHLAARQAPAMNWDDTLGNLRTLDRWRAAVGVVYDAETAEGLTLPADKRPLAIRADAVIPTGTLPGVDKPISRLIMGAMASSSPAYAAALYDDFFARGGTTFDTARVYGASERLLGWWIRARGIREQVVLLDKGAHTPNCTPQGIDTEFATSLSELGTDYVDLYMMHRDNPEVPVGEFIDTLNRHVAAGRMRAFGVSNWTPARVEEANAYAAAHGLVGIVAVSNNLSLARMVDAVWPGSISADRAWFTRTQMPLFAWSSQARGFFTRARPDDLSDDGLVRSWYSDDNFARLARAQELAAHIGVEPIHIALAYVLHQPFPTYALIGPATPMETISSLRALPVTLTPDEVRWLNLGEA